MLLLLLYIYIWSVIVSYLRRMRNIVFGGFAWSVPFVCCLRIGYTILRTRTFDVAHATLTPHVLSFTLSLSLSQLSFSIPLSI